MRVDINLNTLSQRLKLSISARGMEVLKDKAKAFILKVHKEAKDWKKEIREKLSKPAVSRGYTKGRLNPHSSPNMNNSFPMKISGKLRDSLRYRVTQRNNKDSVVITIKRWFEVTMSKSGVDYGELLDTRHPLLQGYKERAYNILDARLRSLR